VKQAQGSLQEVSLGAAVALARYLRLPALAECVAQDSRVAGQPLVDKEFATTRQIGPDVYATISDISIKD